jgi:hypothetical protein
MPSQKRMSSNFTLMILYSDLMKDETVIAMMDIDGGGEVVPDLVHRGEKAFEGQGSAEVAENIHFRHFLFLLLFIGDADDDRVIAGLFESEHDLVVQQPDIPEDDIGAIVGHQLVDFRRRIAFGSEKERLGVLAI